MKLQRLRVDQFRQFRKPLEITGFSAGLNLFAGPNESGKSTLAGAIRAAFFERHRSGSVDDLRPWGDSGAAPEVELEFDHDDRHWHLRKRFLARKRCDLSIGDEVLSGDDAEERLAQSFGFQFPSRGASKSEHWGIPGLLWIEQGMGQELRPAVAVAADHLKSALGATLGEVTSSSGDEILQQVEASLGELVTRTGKPRGEYRDTGARVDALATELEALDKRILDYRQQVDRLSELSAQQAREEREQPWEDLHRQQREAERKHAEVEQLSQRQSRDEKDLETCQGNIQLLSDQLAGFHRQVDELGQRERALVQVQEELNALLARRERLQADLNAATRGYDQARETERQTLEQTRRRELEGQRQMLAQRQQRLAENLTQARTLETELLTQQQQLADNPLDATQLKALETLQGSRRELSIRQQSIATRLRFELEPGQSLRINGEAVSGTGEQRLLRETEVTIARVGRLCITPGGEDLGDLARELERLDEQLHARLTALRVDSLEQARQRLEDSRILAGQVASNRKLLDLHAPEGIQALVQEHARAGQRLQALDAELQALPAAAPADLPSPEMASQQRAQAESQLRQVEAADRELHGSIIRSEQALDTAVAECRNLRASIDDPRRRQQEQDCRLRLEQLRQEEARLTSAIRERGERIASAHPGILAQDVERFRSSAERLLQAHHQRHEERIRLQAQLQTQGADGLEEARAQVAAELESVGRRHLQLHQRASALRLLADLLTEKRRALTRQLQAPLQKHLNHYLQLLFPRARLEVDENLVPGQLVRPDQDAGDFADLSFGAREQMGLISRLAYADLLREAGRPTLIILDDALVHSDGTRLAQMKRILFDASRRHQVLLFTCHPQNWQDMGVAVREMTTLEESEPVTQS